MIASPACEIWRTGYSVMKSKAGSTKKTSSKASKRPLKVPTKAELKTKLTPPQKSNLKVPTLRSNLRRTVKMVRKHWRPLLWATIVYGALYFAFVRVLTRIDVNDLSNTVAIAFGDGEETFLTQIITTSTLYGESVNFDNASGIIYFVVTLMASLAFIWLLRYIWAGKKPKAKQAYYQGMYPMVPYALVFLFMLVQLIPFSLAAFVFQTAINNSLAISIIERGFFLSIFAAGAIFSAYLIIGSIIASYAVTVPGVTPGQARKTAKRMLLGRRFLVLRQVIIFLFLTSLLALAPTLLVVWQAPGAANAVAALFIVLGVPWMNFYFYGLYRDLLNE